MISDDDDSVKEPLYDVKPHLVIGGATRSLLPAVTDTVAVVVVHQQVVIGLKQPPCNVTLVARGAENIFNDHILNTSFRCGAVRSGSTHLPGQQQRLQAAEVEQSCGQYPRQPPAHRGHGQQAGGDPQRLGESEPDLSAASRHHQLLGCHLPPSKVSTLCISVLTQLSFLQARRGWVDRHWRLSSKWPNGM